MHGKQVGQALGLAGIVLVLVGCSSKSTVTGKVTYKGKALHDGTVLFISTESGAAFTSSIEEDGQYTIRRVPPGPVKIAVQTTQPPGTNVPPKALAFLKQAKQAKQRMTDLPKGVELPPEAVADLDKPFQPIPPHYWDPETSKLTYTVTAGQQTHDIELK